MRCVLESYFIENSWSLQKRNYHFHTLILYIGMKFFILLLYVLSKFRSFFSRIYSNMYNIELWDSLIYNWLCWARLFLFSNSECWAIMIRLIMILSFVKRDVKRDKCLIKDFDDLFYWQMNSVFSSLSKRNLFEIKWGELDLNQRRQSQRIYSPSPLATRASPHLQKWSWLRKQ